MEHNKDGVNCAVANQAIAEWYGMDHNKDISNCAVVTLADYQHLAARTINTELSKTDQGKHALFGMCGEIGELQSLYQKQYQGHPFDEQHAKKELGDLLWFIAEYCTAHDWTLEEIATMNIEKLKARYLEGFKAEQSLHRAEGDI